ncbi:DinB family protein [Cesiribacter andamanensis]|uniref:Metal-dependent hydrolase n=1 Tax=Cesiribacter andamanensis AMV16 TaxID=1279009 RepID=M7N8G0_9BACT|nr:DinB family protein [Cesiribacter andamanensis]EMR03552.1 metal-dependent hydrolase [Cesiribacter andamanensis AMV16]
MRPAETEYAPFYQSYVARVKEEEAILALERSYEEIHHFMPLLPEGRADFRYAEDKWSVKEMIQHIIDTERIMAYRALTFARGDQREIPGFNQDGYAEMANVDYRSLQELREELQLVRKSSICLFASFDEGSLNRTGIANRYKVSVRALAYIIAGHQKHHFAQLRERYFPDMQMA